MALRLFVSILICAALVTGCSHPVEKGAVEAERPRAENAVVGGENRIFSYFDWIVANSGSRHFRVDAAKAAFEDIYDNNSTLKEMVPRDIFETLTDGRTENGEAKRFRLTLDNLLMVRISTGDPSFPGGEYDAVKRLTLEQARLLYTESKKNAPARGLLVHDSPPPDLVGF